MNNIAGSDSAKQQVELQTLYNELKELRKKVEREEAKSLEKQPSKGRLK